MATFYPLFSNPNFQVVEKFIEVRVLDRPTTRDGAVFLYLNILMKRLCKCIAKLRGIEVTILKNIFDLTNSLFT